MESVFISLLNHNLKNTNYKTISKTLSSLGFVIIFLHSINCFETITQDSLRNTEQESISPPSYEEVIPLFYCSNNISPPSYEDAIKKQNEEIIITKDINIMIKPDQSTEQPEKTNPFVSCLYSFNSSLFFFLKPFMFRLKIFFLYGTSLIIVSVT